jgi:predicted AAA+ superfamily ATPase
MQRLILKDLEKWKSSNNRKPLIIQGARQVGKTWVMKEFGEAHFHQVVYIYFESSVRLQSIFKDDFDLEKSIEDHFDDEEKQEEEQEETLKKNKK